MACGCSYQFPRVMPFYSRLDFDQFNVMGPETVNHMCSNDQFIVSGATNPVPAICGVNSGNHSKFYTEAKSDYLFFI